MLRHSSRDPNLPPTQARWARETFSPNGGVLLKTILFVLALALLGLSPAFADVPANPNARLDAAKATIDQVESSLSRGDLSDTDLQALRAEIDPVAAEMMAVAAELAPRLDAAKARLAQLGPKPGPKDPPEAADISAERASQEKLFNDLDATAKRAKVLAVQASQTSGSIGARLRAAFAHALFARSSSLLSPALWGAVIRELPADYRAVSTLTGDWATASWNRLSEAQRLTLAGLLLLIAALYWPVWQLARRVRGRADAASPTRLRKGLAALRVAVATAAVPIGAILAVGAILDFFDLPGQFQTIGRALMVGIAVVAVSTGLARGLLAPKSPNWRLPPLSDLGAKALYHVTIAITVVVAIERFVEAVNEVIAVALPTAVATRGLGSLAVAAVLLAEIRKGVRARAAAAQDTSRTPQMEHWAAILRLIAWIVVLVLIGAVLVGYVAFAAFLVQQIIEVAGTLALLYLLLVISDQGLAAAFRPKAVLSRALKATLGLKADTLDQISVLLAGIARVSLYVIAILLVLAPWRIESADMLATAQAAFFGFTVGDVTVSLSALIVAILLFAFSIVATRAVQRWLEVKFLPRTKLDSGLRNSIKTSLGYVGFVVALALGLSHLGLSFERLTLVAGGLSLGIGLGLQTVTNNFVSGLILLWERAVRVGDWITVGEEQGYVRRINVRSTELETLDRALVIMPNSSLITGVVKNWVRNDRIGRIKLPFTVPLTADPEVVRSTLIGTAKAHGLVVAIPAPQVFFTALNDTGMKFELVCFVEDVEAAVRVTSELLFEIHARFKDAGLAQPAPPPVVSSPALDKLDAWLTGKLAGGAPPAPGE